MRYVSHIIFIALILGSVCTMSTHAEKRYAWEYLYTVDGDTIAFQALWSPLPDKKILVRLNAIDTPEKHSLCAEERERALKAKEFVKRELEEADKIEVEPLAWDKWGGRILGRVVLNGKIDLSEKILAAGLARGYHGEKKESWC